MYINDKPIIIAGKDMYHAGILELSLKKFNINFKTRLNDAQEIKFLSEIGRDYELVGAGRLKMFDEETLYFYDNSADYIGKIKGTNNKHLEQIFGSDKVLQDRLHREFVFFCKSLYLPFNNA